MEQKVDVSKYEEIKNQYIAYKNQASKLEEELKNNIEEEKKLTTELADIEASTEEVNININKAKKEEGAENELKNKCKEVVDYFLKDINSNMNVDNIIGSNLSMRIEYQNMKIFKSLLDPNITFEKLKEETKLQFGKEADEFYFADENNNIFLDELKVIPALFPLSMVKVRNYEPLIKVIDKIHPKRNKVNINDEEEILNTNDNKIKFSIKDDIIKWLENNYLKILYLICYLIWIILWVKSRLNFLTAEKFKTFQASNQILIDKANFSNDTKDFMKNLGKSLFQMFEFGPFDFDDPVYIGRNDNSYHTYYNDFLGYIRLIQKRYKENINCSSKKIKDENEINCINKIKYLKDKTATFGDDTYDYVKSPCSLSFKGFLDKYDNDGYVLDIPIINSTILKNVIKSNENYFNESHTASIILMINMYNRNLNMISIIRVLFENLFTKIAIQNQTEIFKIKPNIDSYTIVSIFFCIFAIIITIMNCLKQEKNNFRNRKKNKKFKIPKSYEIIAIVNFILYFIIIIYSSTMVNKSMRNTPIDTEKFNNYSKYSVRYDIHNIFSSITFLIGFIVLILIFSEDLEEFRVIIRTMKNFIFGIWPFIIFWILLFLLICYFIVFFLTGDFSEIIYRESYFIFIKVIQSVFRGTIDNFEFSDKKFISSLHNSLFNSKNQFERIYDKIGIAGYILYSFIFYIIVFIFLKGAIIGFCYLIYRDMYIEEKKKKTIENKVKERLKKKEINDIQKNEKENGSEKDNKK